MKKHANAEHYAHFCDSLNRNLRKVAKRNRPRYQETAAENEELNVRAEAFALNLNLEPFKVHHGRHSTPSR